MLGYDKTMVNESIFILFSLFSIIIGITLTKENPTATWDPENKEDFVRTNKLIIKQFLLGSQAKADEFNVVEVIIFHPSSVN